MPDTRPSAVPTTFRRLEPRVLRHATRRALLCAALTFAGLAATMPAHAASPPGPAAGPRAFSVHDLVMFKRIASPTVSPDGTRIAFALRETDLAANRGRVDLWLVDADGRNLRQLTFTPESESSPTWSPDGRALYFLAGRGGSQQVWRLPLDGGEAQRVTDFGAHFDVGSFVVSPDGTRLAVALEVFPDCAAEKDGALACTARRLDERAKSKASGRLYNQLFVRHWDTWKDGRRSHLFVVPVAAGKAAGADVAIDLMKTMDADAPSKPFGGSDEFTFTPDSTHVVFTARDAGREEAWSTNLDLFVARGDGADPSARPRNLTAASKGTDTRPMFSPDGASLLYLSMPRAGYEADRLRLMLRSGLEGAEREIAPAWDRSPSDVVWSADGKTIYATADNLGQHSLFAIDVATGAAREVVREGNIGGLGLAGGRLVYGKDHLRSPVDLYSVAPDGKDERRLTQVNAERLAQVKFGEPEQFTFKGWNNETVHAWIVRPVDFDPAKKYPAAFLIHGGPQGSFGNDFHYRWNPQTYAGAGYVAIMVDFHGSTGYGQAFTDSIRMDWGGKPLEDLQKGLAAATAKYTFIDADRVCALGASYGGYMINWIAGKWPDRFRCLVSHDGNLDEQFAYFDTEELWLPEWEHGGVPWEKPENFQKHNPINLVKNWKTPILVVHGGLDFRVVDTQGIATFTAAQRRGIPSQFLHFPDENHWVLKPQNSILWHETVKAWLDRWTAPAR